MRQFIETMIFWKNRIYENVSIDRENVCVLEKKIVAVWETILMIAVSKLVGSNNQYTPVCFLYQNQYKINKWLWCNLFARS